MLGKLTSSFGAQRQYVLMYIITYQDVGSVNVFSMRRRKEDEGLDDEDDNLKNDGQETEEAVDVEIPASSSSSKYLVAGLHLIFPRTTIDLQTWLKSPRSSY